MRVACHTEPVSGSRPKPGGASAKCFLPPGKAWYPKHSQAPDRQLVGISKRSRCQPVATCPAIWLHKCSGPHVALGLVLCSCCTWTGDRHDELAPGSSISARFLNTSEGLPVQRFMRNYAIGACALVRTGSYRLIDRHLSIQEPQGRSWKISELGLRQETSPSSKRPLLFFFSVPSACRRY